MYADFFNTTSNTHYYFSRLVKSKRARQVKFRNLQTLPFQWFELRRQEEDRCFRYRSYIRNLPRRIPISSDTESLRFLEGNKSRLRNQETRMFLCTVRHSSQLRQPS